MVGGCASYICVVEVGAVVDSHVGGGIAGPDCVDFGVSVVSSIDMMVSGGMNAVN